VEGEVEEEVEMKKGEGRTEDGERWRKKLRKRQR
jgi:hypothetical protein